MFVSRKAPPIGQNAVKVVAPGFQSYTQAGVRLQVNGAVQINMAMKIGEIAPSAQVQANANHAVDAENMVSQDVDQLWIVELPLNGGNPKAK